MTLPRPLDVPVLNRRSLIAAATVGLAAASTPMLASASSSEAVAVLSADTASLAAIRTSLTRQGWTRVAARGEQGQRIAGGTRQTTAAQVRSIRKELGGEPAVWVVDLVRPRKDAAAETRALLKLLGTKARMIVWCGPGWSVARPDSGLAKVRAAIEPSVSRHSTGVFAEWSAYVSCHDDRRWWSGSTLTAQGQQEKAAFLAGIHVGPPRGKESLRWNPSRLLTHRAPVTTGQTYVDIRSLRSWDPTRRELRDQLVGLDRGAVVTLPAGRFEISGFQAPWLGGIRLGQAGTRGQQLVRGFRGAGRATQIRLREKSSRHGDLVAPGRIGATNPLEVMRFQDIRGCELTNLSLYGSEQGHLYHGLAFGNCPGLLLDGLYLRGLSRGDSDRPPGETFSVNIGGGANTVIRNCEFDGRDEKTGQRVSTSMVGWNGPGSSLARPQDHARGARMENIWVHDGRAGMVTWWLWDHIVTINLWSDRVGGQSLNHEESGTLGTPVLHYNPSLVVRGHWESRHGSPLSGCDQRNKGHHWSMWSAHADQSNVKIYFLRPDDRSQRRGVDYRRHDRGPDLESGALSVNNGRGYAGGNRSVTPARVFKSSGTEVTELTVQQAGQSRTRQSTHRAYFVHR